MNTVWCVQKGRRKISNRSVGRRREERGEEEREHGLLSVHGHDGGQRCPRRGTESTPPQAVPPPVSPQTGASASPAEPSGPLCVDGVENQGARQPGDPLGPLVECPWRSYFSHLFLSSPRVSDCFSSCQGAGRVAAVGGFRWGSRTWWCACSGRSAPSRSRASTTVTA